MKNKILFLFLILVCHSTMAQMTVSCGQQSIYWSDDFEGAIPGWSATNGLWQIGTPTVGPSGALGGVKCAGTNLNGNYPANASSILSNNIPITIPPANLNPRLRFWQWYSFSNTVGTDYGRVKIKAATGSTWMDLSTISYVANGSGVWSREEIDLTPYSDSVVYLGFLMQDIHPNSSSTQSSGWYIDNVEIITGPYININSEGFENGWRDWSAEGSWEIGIPTMGPTGSCTGTQCAGTNLNGNYGRESRGHLKSPWMKMAPASQNPSISYCYWFAFANAIAVDYGTLRFRTPTSGWKDTVTYTGSSSVWSNAFFNMSNYADSIIQFGFYFQDIHPNSSAGQSLGWYIDDVYIGGLPDTSCYGPGITSGENELIGTRFNFKI
jgi:bacillopeptidase F (M6 metalloprotease family)